MALCGPLANVAAAWLLARHGGHSYGRELLRNQLILSTVAGLVANVAGLSLADAVSTTLQRIGLAAALAWPPDQRLIVVLFAALPTASGAYVLAARMGGDGACVAGLVTLSTLPGMLSVPFWLALVR
jgi:predicted permease